MPRCRRMMTPEAYRIMKEEEKKKREERQLISTPLEVEENIARVMKGEALTIPLSHLHGAFRRKFYKRFETLYFKELGITNPITKAWREKNKEKIKGYMDKSMKKIKEDPEKYKLYRQRLRDNQRRSYAKTRADPVQWEIYKEKYKQYEQRARMKRFMAKHNCDKKTFEWHEWMRKNRIQKYYTGVYGRLVNNKPLKDKAETTCFICGEKVDKRWRFHHIKKMHGEQFKNETKKEHKEEIPKKNGLKGRMQDLWKMEAT